MAVPPLLGQAEARLSPGGQRSIACGRVSLGSTGLAVPGCRVPAVKRWWLWPLAAVLLAVVGVVAVRLDAAQPSTQLTPAATQALAEDGMTPVGGQPAPDFQLIDQNGRPVSLSQFRHKVVLLSFLDPVCWIDCPLQAQEMAEVDRLVGPQLARRVVLLAVVANPIYHSLADVRSFDSQELLDGLPNWTFATSPSVARLRQIWKAYYVDVSTPSNGMVQHADLFYLIGPGGDERYVSNPTADPSYVWGTGQLLASYVLRMLHQPAVFAATRPAPLPPTAPAGAAIATPGPVAVHFDSPSQGWLIVDAPPYQVVEVTHDAGAHWTDVGPPGISKRGGLAWGWVDAERAWILVRPFAFVRDTSVYATASAGRAWDTPAVLPGAPDPRAIRPLAAAGGTRAGLLLAGQIWTTADGGSSWRPGARLPARADHLGLSWSGTQAWLSGGAETPGAAVLWRSQSGRAAWVRVTLPLPARLAGARAISLPPRWTTSRSGSVAVVAQASGEWWLWVDATDDGGGSWRQVLAPIRVGATALNGGVQPAGDDVYALAAGLTGGVWMGVESTGTWSRLGGSLPAAGARAIDFSDPSHGWVVTANSRATALWRTRDGGRTWAAVRLPAAGASAT